MSKCTYCGKMYDVPFGTTVADSVSGIMRYYCSSKCRKNAEMKRKKKKWTNQGKK